MKGTFCTVNPIVFCQENDCAGCLVKEGKMPNLELLITELKELIIERTPTDRTCPWCEQIRENPIYDNPRNKVNQAEWDALIIGIIQLAAQRLFEFAEGKVGEVTNEG